MDEQLLHVEELPYKNFDRLKFYKKHKIELGPEDKTKITMGEAKDEMKKILDVKYKTGFAYFLLEYCIVSHPTYGYIRLRDKAYKWQVKAAIDFLSGRYIISKKTRQVAFSTTVGAYCLWRALFYDSQRVAVVSKTQDDANEFLDRVKFIYEHLPSWLKQPTSEWAVKSVKFAHNSSKITSIPNRGDPAQGTSLSLLVADEMASYQDPQSVLSASTPALAAGALASFTNKTLPSQFFVISTLPRKKVVDNEYLRLLHGAQANPETSRYKIVDVEVDDIAYYRSREWHLEMLETLGPRGYKIEVVGIEVFVTEHSLFESWVLENIKTINPIRCDFLNPNDVDKEGYYKDLSVFAQMKENFDPEYGYIKGLWIWNDPIPEKQYIIVCDVAGGEASDLDAFHVFDPETGEQVAEYNGRVNTEEYKQLVKIVCEYYNEAKLSAERNGLGINLCQYFGNTIEYENFYWHKKSKKVYMAGFPMVNPYRSHAIAFMEGALTKGEIKIKSIRTLNELRNFGMTRKGKIAAISGHDDLVMALAQYCWLVEAGWAVSDKMMEKDLYGEAKDDEEETKNKDIPKYWEDSFDADNLSPEQQETLNFIKATGSSISKETMEHFID